MVEFFIVACVLSIGLMIWTVLGKNQVAGQLSATQEQLSDVKKLAREHQATLDRHKRIRPDEDARLRQEIIGKLLALDDHVQRAVDGMAQADAESLRQGLTMIARDLDATWSQLEVHRVRPELGAAFDATRHEAIASHGTGTAAQIEQVVRDGFELNGVLIRPARVVVIKVVTKETDVPHDDAPSESDEEVVATENSA